MRRNLIRIAATSLRARAAEHYAQFIELWQDADAELQPRVREARRRLAALRGGR